MFEKKLPESFMYLMICYREEMTKLIAESDLGVSLNQVKSIKVIQMVEECTPIHIAKANHLDKAQVTRIVHDLVEKDLVEKAQNPNDKRSQILLFTPEGKALLKKIRDLEESILVRMTSGVSETEISEFNRVANKLAQNLR